MQFILIDLQIFREPLRNHQLPGQFPNDIELKTMFDGLLPIIAVHEKILNELEPVVKNWKAENEIGKIFQAHVITHFQVNSGSKPSHFIHF